MAFVRWVFYDEENGTVRYEGMQQGDFHHIPASAMAKKLCIENVGCMEWLEPDPAIEAAFSDVDAEGNPRIVSVSVDVSGEEPQLVFTYTTIEDVPAGDDPYQIIDILTGGDA